MDIIEQLQKREEILWRNPNLQPIPANSKIGGYSFIFTQAAQNRFMRYLPYIAEVFPETAEKKGVIESGLLPIPHMTEWLNSRGAGITGKVYLKDDAHLPIAGSVKARGGIHEVLAIAEHVAMKEGFMLPSDDHRKLNSEEARAIFAKYTIQVGSTGNLGISIGRTASRMGFHAVVHMSSDAKEWKKELLRREGVTVKEYDGDYSLAVASGRKEAEADPYSFFIDDEKSKELFFGYSTAALRLKVQFRKAHNPVDRDHPLFVYLPCGVGGAPGGITFGLKQLFGEDVHCFFAEPVEAPCMLLGMSTGKHENICVQEIGLTGKTEADGLAVGRASSLACAVMEEVMSGDYTVSDQHLLEYQQKMMETEGIYLEPSACAGFRGLEEMCRHSCAEDGSDWNAYIREHNLAEHMDQATHVVWATGGGLAEKYQN